MVSSTVGSPTRTGWNRRSRAGSFSMLSRYSSSVVAPTMRSSPRASIGLSMLPASIEPSPLPAPTTVCSSSRNVMIWPSELWISSSTDLSRSSNWPRYCAPATIAPRSRLTSRLSRSDSGTSPATMRWARPSTIAVLPTPGSPISTGLFLVRRDSTWITRRISESRPITGSTLPSRALAVRSTLYFSSAWYCCSGSADGDPPVAAADLRERRDQAVLGDAGGLERLGDRTAAADPGICARPASRCSVETYSSPSGRAIASAAFSALTSSRDEARLGDARTARGGQPVDRVHGGAAHVGRVGADRAQQRGRGRAAGVQQREQQVPGLDGGVAALRGDGDGGGDDLSALGGQALGVHDTPCGFTTFRPTALSKAGPSGVESTRRPRVESSSLKFESHHARPLLRRGRTCDPAGASAASARVIRLP